MDSSSDFLMWLFEETRPYAPRLDALLAPLTASNVTLAHYRDYLVRTLGFEASLEAALAYTRGLSDICDLRARSGHIVHDLLALGMSPHEIATLPQCSIAPFASVATGAGWLYMYERARLQHPLLCAGIRARIPDVGRAMKYFCRDELAVTKRWEQVATALEELATSSGAKGCIRDAALDAFELAIDWYTEEPLRAAQ